MEINYDKKYSGRKLKGSEYAAKRNVFERRKKCLKKYDQIKLGPGFTYY